jgi:hypothetical protein
VPVHVAPVDADPPIFTLAEMLDPVEPLISRMANARGGFDDVSGSDVVLAFTETEFAMETVLFVRAVEELRTYALTAAGALRTAHHRAVTSALTSSFVSDILALILAYTSPPAALRAACAPFARRIIEKHLMMESYYVLPGAHTLFTTF